MKRIIMLFMLLTITLTLAQKTSKAEIEKIIKEQSDGVPGQSIDTVLTTQEVYDDVKSIKPDIENALKSLSKSLKVTVEKVWSVLVRQQLVKSIGYFILMIISLLSWINFYYRIKQGNLNKGSYSWRDSDIAVSVISGLLSIVGTILTSIHFESMLTGFLNPEYGAIKDILFVALKME